MVRSRAPATPARRGAAPAGQADGDARRARDAAQPDRFHGRAPALDAASSWQDLIRGARLDPDPPRFGEPATVSFQLTKRAVQLQLGDKPYLIAVEGSASATAALTLNNPNPPLHVWKCKRCGNGFTLDPTPCPRARPPTLHDWECQVSWTKHHLDGSTTTEYCHSGLTPDPCSHGWLGFHDFHCKHDYCNHKGLTDVVDPRSGGWLDVAGAALCDPGDGPLHDWKCTLCGYDYAHVALPCPKAPGGLPAVIGSFSASADLQLSINDVAERLFVTLNPPELVAWIPQLSSLTAGAYHDGLNGALQKLTSAFPIEGPFRDSFDNICSGAFDPLRDKFAEKLQPLMNGLRDAVIAFAQRELAALNELFERVVEFLALVGDPHAVLTLAGQALAAALKRAQGDAVPKLWKLADQLLALCTHTLPSLAQSLTTQLVVAVAGVFEQHRAQLEVFLEDALARLAGAGQDVLSFARTLVTAVRDGVSLQSSASFLVGVVAALVPGALAAVRSDYPSVLGSLFGVLVAGVEQGDLGVVYGPLVDQLRDPHALTCDEAKLFLQHLGGDTLLKVSLRWIHDHWDRFCVLIREGADELKAWIEYILGLIENAGHPYAFPEAERLIGLLKSLQGLAHTLLAPDLFQEVPGHVVAAAQALRGGFGQWLTQQAPDGGKAQFLRDWIKRDNPLVKNLRRIEAAIAPVLGRAAQAEALSADLVDDALRALYDLEDFEDRLWRIVFEGGAGEGPITAQLDVHGIFADALTAAGASLDVSEPTAFSDSLNSGSPVMGALNSSIAPDASFLSFDVRREKFRVPHPTNTAPINFQSGSSLPPIPLSVPIPWNAGVALCHLPEFWVIDMRYHMPYGDVGGYHVADLDKDGFVRGWEVAKVREAVTRVKREDFYDFALDCDGDGQITENDLELAVEQQHNYVNGMMYRKATSPVGFFVALAPTVWVFVSFTDLNDESIPRAIKRRGIMGVVDGQVAIPLPPGLFKDGQDYYPLRFHYEERLLIDSFESLAPSLGGTSPPIAPLTASRRWDIVARGGKGGRDWQGYFTCEPFNPVLLTWNLMGTLYLRGVASVGAGVGAAGAVAAGAGGKGATYIHFAYETSAPLVEVIEEWSDRFKDIVTTNLGDLPAPWAFFKGILEWTDVPRLSRALIQIAGPIIDLLFDWCDEGHAIRGALGYIRQYTLNKWQPAPTWEQLRAEILTWDNLSQVERDAVVGAVRDTQSKVQKGRTQFVNGTADEEPVYVPWLLARNCKKALPAPSVAAAAQLKKVFEDGRPRFTASLDQLVPAGEGKNPYAGSADIPLCGKFDVCNPFIAAFPVRWQDIKDNKHPSQATLDEILSVRGNPFYKPIYHTVVEFGPEAKLFTCPSRDLNYFIGSAAGQKGLVEGSRMLKDADGTRWLWVRTDSWHHGWIYIDAAVADELFSVKEAAEVAGQQAGQDIAADLLKQVLGAAAGMGLPVDVLGPDAVDKVNHKLADLMPKHTRPTVTKIEASAPSTVDESRYARVCRQMLARRSAGRVADGDGDAYQIYCDAMDEFEARMFGAHAPDLSQPMTPPDENVLEQAGEKLAEAFNKLSVAKREKLWAAGTSWLKIREYGPLIIEAACDALVPPVLSGDFNTAWNNFLAMLKKTEQVQLEDLLLVAQTCAPAVKEVILTMIDIGIKLKSIKDAVTTGDAHLAGAGEVGTPGSDGQTSWKDMGVNILRLLIDDEEDPGRPATPAKQEQRGLRKNHDHGISFSFEVSAKVEEDKPEETHDDEKDPNQRTVALAVPYIVCIEQRDVPDDDDDDDGGGGGDDSEPENDISGMCDDEGQPEAEDEGGDTSQQADGGEVGKAVAGGPLELQITEWGALVYSDPPTAAMVDSARVPKEFKDTVGWQVAVVGEDGAIGDWQDVDGQHGEYLHYDVPPEYAGKQLRFRAYTVDFDWSTVGGSGGGESNGGGGENSGGSE